MVKSHIKMEIVVHLRFPSHIKNIYAVIALATTLSCDVLPFQKFP